MGTNSGVRLTNTSDLTRALTIYADGLPDAMEDGLYAALDAGALVMKDKLEASATYTGRKEHPQHPGRHRTGSLVDSIWDDVGDEPSDSYSLTTRPNGDIKAEFGILDPPNLEAALAQEFGTGNKGGAVLGGGTGGIEGMMIVQAGFNTVVVSLNNALAERLTALGRDAEAKRAYTRSRTAANRANPNVRD